MSDDAGAAGEREQGHAHGRVQQRCVRVLRRAAVDEETSANCFSCAAAASAHKHYGVDGSLRKSVEMPRRGGPDIAGIASHLPILKAARRALFYFDRARPAPLLACMWRAYES